MSVSQISAQQLQKKLQGSDDLLLLDVREADEYNFARIENSHLIPLGELSERFDELDAEKEMIVMCHHGVRSQYACIFLQQQGFIKLYNLEGGIDAWSVHCDPSVPRYC